MKETEAQDTTLHSGYDVAFVIKSYSLRKK
jgi:hypothetical protein